MGHSKIMVSLTYLRGLDVAKLKEEDMPMIYMRPRQDYPKLALRVFLCAP